MATNEQTRVRDWMKAFGQSCPETPTIPSLEIRKLRAKLILEETKETIYALGFELPIGNYEFIQTQEPNLIDIIDGCEDLKVVTEGTLVACGCLTPAVPTSYVGRSEEGMACYESEEPHDAHFNEVMRANEGKLWSEREWNDCKNRANLRVKIQSGILSLDTKKCLVTDSTGKIIKPPSFTPPDHKKILDERNK